MVRIGLSQLQALESLRKFRSPLARGILIAGLVSQAASSAIAANTCEPVSPSSFEFLKQPPFVKTGWTVETQGIENTCQVEVVQASLPRVLRNAVQRQLGPPFDGWFLRHGWVSAKAHTQMNEDPSLAIPLRADSEKHSIAKRLGYAKVLKWEFLGPTEFLVEVGYRDLPTQPMHLERVRYRTENGKNWYLDEIVK